MIVFMRQKTTNQALCDPLPKNEDRFTEQELRQLQRLMSDATMGPAKMLSWLKQNFQLLQYDHWKYAIEAICLQRGVFQNLVINSSDYVVGIREAIKEIGLFYKAKKNKYEIAYILKLAYSVELHIKAVHKETYSTDQALFYINLMKQIAEEEKDFKCNLLIAYFNLLNALDPNLIHTFMFFQFKKRDQDHTDDWIKKRLLKHMLNGDPLSRHLQKIKATLKTFAMN